jgi:hypothetical protein
MPHTLATLHLVYRNLQYFQYTVYFMSVYLVVFGLLLLDFFQNFVR